MFIPPIVPAPINSVFKICSNFHRMCTKIRNSRLALMYMHHTPSKGMDYQSAFSFHKIHAAFLIPLSFSLRTKPGSARVKIPICTSMEPLCTGYITGKPRQRPSACVTCRCSQGIMPSVRVPWHFGSFDFFIPYRVMHIMAAVLMLLPPLELIPNLDLTLKSSLTQWEESFFKHLWFAFVMYCFSG